jgi:hypothetical protein
MGLLDIPAPVLAWADERLAAVLPAGPRIVIWGGLGAAASMGLYWLLSPQRRIEHLITEERRLKTTLRSEATEIKEGLAAAKRLLGLAASRIGLILPSVLVAALPVLCLMAWLDTQYGRDLPPPGETARVEVTPATFRGHWVAADAGTPRIDVVDQHDAVVHSFLLSAPVAVVHRRAWWNALIENPLGYLPDDGPITRVEIGLPVQHYISMGPDWIRGWEAPFIAAMLIGSIALKILFHIH